jgi:hypothetical protein
MTRLRWFCMALLLITVAGCAGDPYGPDANGVCPLVPLARMPAEVRANLVFVQASISGHPVNLLVDTGAERTLLTEATVDRLKLPRDTHHETRTQGIGSPTATWDAELPEGLTLGGTRFPVDSVTVGKFDINHLPGGNTDGLLGADILLAFDMDLDLPNSQVTLYRARRQCPTAGPPWKEPYITLNGITTKRDRLLVPFELDGVKSMAVLDTGAQLSSVSGRLAQELGVSDAALAADRKITAHGAAPDQVSVPVHRFHELRVGPAVLQAPFLPVIPMTDGMGDALVGADFLQGRRVWLSFATHQMFVTPRESGPAIALGR